MKKRLNVFYFLLLLFAIGCGDEMDDSKDKVFSEEKIESRQQVKDDFPLRAPCLITNFRISIDPCFDDLPIYLSAIQAAANAYNNLNNNAINIIFVPSNGDVHIDCFSQFFILTEDFNAGLFYSDNELLELNIDLDALNNSCPENFGLAQLTALVIHEMGHMIRLNHTGTDNGQLIEGTPFEDPNSIFNANSRCDNINEFSAFDLVALEALYGCDNYAPQIIGPANFCANQEVTFCLDTAFSCNNIEWLGYPEFEDQACLTLSLENEGSGFVYADVQLGDCIYHLSKKIEVGPPNIVDNLEVKFKPCDGIIEIKGLAPNTTYDWGDFTGLRNEPSTVMISGSGNGLVTIHVPYDGGESFCFTVSTSSECGSSELPCEVCYTTPNCEGFGTGLEQDVIVSPSNLCDYGECPEGSTCTDGICCVDEVVDIEPCDNPCEEDCGPGYDCIEECCVAVGGNPCFSNKLNKCPPGFECIDGICQEPW